MTPCPSGAGRPGDLPAKTSSTCCADNCKRNGDGAPDGSTTAAWCKARRLNTKRGWFGEVGTRRKCPNSRDQRAYLTEGAPVAVVAPIASGKPGWSTPTG